MRAVRIHGFGGPEVMVVEEIERPEPRDDQVLIRVLAAGVNWADAQRRSSARYPVPIAFPHTVGQELVGEVEAVGAAVTRYREGDLVFALPNSGAYAEYAVAAEHELLPVPEGLDPTVGLSVVMHGLTAMAILKDAAPLRAGDTMFVQAAGGGVGLMAIQLAKLYGAGTVVAAASTPDKRRIACDHGADVAVDLAADDWTQVVRDATDGRGVDVVLDCVGGAVGKQSMDLVADWGRIVTYGVVSNEPVAVEILRLPARNVTLRSLFVLGYLARPDFTDTALAELAAFVADGRLKPHIGGRYTLDQAQTMHEHMEARTTAGKLLVVPS